ncbi:efflux RND transporter permease subunit [Apibacter muscae]|uniref:Efflux RND transporter permease subunit n=1 Tax=Apibacter muscae TaxID=2509004 RepID=A0A563D9P8_9FLAO|nr:efflux RND transporter permease subunit [Apibacter muscae]TWP26641.1 efflux RND transporter permease subunit [Apibacter muscae]TWP28215.1 efflux RND transporter permease subunit [Apibacter muscae]
MFKIFIERPILSTVISIIILILGGIGMVTLPVAQYPEIAPPTVQVTANYPGASADVVLKSVVIPLEEQINGVDNMTYMTSTASNDGSATITIYFKQDANPDIAAVNVQNLAARANSLLPAEVTKNGVIVQKTQSSNILFMGLISKNPNFDQKFLQNYANINILPEIKRINGVGDAQARGGNTYAMRIWINPDKMAIYGITPSDISAVLAEQNLEAAAGSFGDNSNQTFEYPLRYTGRLTDAKQFQNIVLKSLPSGDILRLKDVADVEIGAESYQVTSTIDGYPSTIISVSQTAGSNARKIIEEVEVTMKEAAKSYPSGIETVFMMNANDFLNASIDKVIHTLIEAFILVFIVVLVFLQDLRSTIIPAISVIVAIVGTFFFLLLLGFTINILTLFALILAIGIVVDDAIVVVEAVHSKLENGMKDSKKASIHAMTDIAGAIVAITLVMASVFVPVSFIGGTAGVFYKQFGLTLAISIVISAVNALTLSPALCAIFLKPHSDDKHKTTFITRLKDGFNVAFKKTTNKYKRILILTSKAKWSVFAIILVFSGLLYYLMKTTPTDFVPQEDSGFILSDISLPPGSTMEQSTKIGDEVNKIASKINGVEHIAQLNGLSFLSGAGGNYSVVLVKLKPWSERPNINIKDVVKELFIKTAHIQGARIIFFGAPTLQGFGNSNGFELQLQDKTGGSLSNFYEVSQQFLGALNKRPEIQYATSSFDPNFPQYEMSLNIAEIKRAGLKATDILGALQGYVGGIYASNYNQFGKQYKVYIQSHPSARKNLTDLDGMYVRNASGDMAPIGGFVTIKPTNGPQTLQRFNLYQSIPVSGSPNQGYSAGDAVNVINEVAAQTLPQGYSFEYSGMTREQVKNSGSQTVYIFILCLVFVYFLLSALYESYILPISIIISLPIGIAGAFLFAKLFGITNNIYLQICLIMLIGLLAKNSILIVEYALERRLHGLSIIDAAIEGAEARFRPILMTSFAFILGLLPLMFASGAGAEGNRSIGTAAVGGMLIGTIVGLVVTPMLYVIFQTIQEKITKIKPATTVKEDLEDDDL